MGWLIGTYDADMDGTGEGVYAADELPGTLRLQVRLAAPSFLLADGDRVHATLEGDHRVATFAGDRVQRMHEAGGEAPCHLTALGDRLVVANYGTGTVAVIGPDGPEQVLPGEGSGPHEAQDGPHAHATLLVGDTLLSADLGADVVWVHAVEGTAVRRTGSIRFAAGAGPRDLHLLPSGDVLVLAELDGGLHLLRGDEPVHTVTLPGFEVGDHASAIGVRGDLVYCGIRGSNRVAVVRVAGDRLEPVADVDCGGDWPRHLVVDGDALHVANQRSGDIATFDLAADGIPRLRARTAAPTPVYLLRVP